MFTKFSAGIYFIQLYTHLEFNIISYIDSQSMLLALSDCSIYLYGWNSIRKQWTDHQIMNKYWRAKSRWEKGNKKKLGRKFIYWRKPEGGNAIKLYSIRIERIANGKQNILIFYSNIWMVNYRIKWKYQIKSHRNL